jgi:hypothetical protein
MTSKSTIQVMHTGECTDHHCYKVGITGTLILCEFCGRVKAIKEKDEWKMMY